MAENSLNSANPTSSLLLIQASIIQEQDEEGFIKLDLSWVMCFWLGFMIEIEGRMVRD